MNNIKNKKSIGIITFQKNTNSYGAALQAYATYKFLVDNGYRAEIIDICREGRLSFRLGKKYRLFTRKMYYKILKGTIFNLFCHSVRIYRFNLLNSQLKYSKRYKRLDDLYENQPQYDVYCTGSDQTFNPNITICPEPYLLTFVGPSAKKISYASSFGICKLPDQYIKLYKEALLQYSHILIRENSAKKILNEIIENKDVDIVIDPTMLLSADHYRNIMHRSSRNNYIFVYLLSEDIAKLNFAKRIADYNNLDLIVCGNKKIVGPRVTCYSQLGPLEWLGFISGAKHIITDSFHGTVFSMLLNNNFMTCIYSKEKSTRIIHLLDIFNLSQHLLQDFDNPYNIGMTSFDRKSFEIILNEKKQKSSSLFINAIED